MKKAVCLVSGGLDSAVALFKALQSGYECYPINFDYGQRHFIERVAAGQLIEHAASLGHRVHAHVTVPVGLHQLTRSALTGQAQVPKDRSLADMSAGVPDTYVQGRNTVFLALAFSYAETVGAEAIFTGFNILDYSGYPDCRPEYVEAFNRLISIAAPGKTISVESPLIRLSKKEIILLGKELGVPFGLTWSCYQGLRTPCGHCDSCLIRQDGFESAGVKDE